MLWLVLTLVMAPGGALVGTDDIFICQNISVRKFDKKVRQERGIDIVRSGISKVLFRGKSHH